MNVAKEVIRKDREVIFVIEAEERMGMSILASQIWKLVNLVEKNSEVKT